MGTAIFPSELLQSTHRKAPWGLPQRWLRPLTALPDAEPHTCQNRRFGETHIETPFEGGPGGQAGSERLPRTLFSGQAPAADSPNGLNRNEGKALPPCHSR